MISQHKIINRILLPIAYVLGWVILYFLPRRMFNVGGDNSAEPWILFACVFFGLPLLLNLVLKRNGITGDKLKAIVYSSVFLAVPFVLFIDSEDNQELKTYGSETRGIIDKAWLSTHRRRASIWSVQAKYVVDGKEYRTSTKNDTDKTLFFGDSVTVIYSSRTPEMSEIKELIQYYDWADASR